MSEPTVSTIIPAYRAAATIGRAVGSLLAQSRPPDEIVVVDDGSPDDLAAALGRLRTHVTLIRKPNGGAASARNLGIDRSSGDVITFLDADDYWEPAKLRRQLEVFRHDPEVGLAAGRYYTQAPGQDRRPSSAAGKVLFGRVLRPRGEAVFDVMAEVWTSTVAVRRAALGGHRFVPGLEPAEDRDLWIRLAASCPVYLDPAPLATYVLEPGSLSRSSIDRDCGNMLRVVHRHEALLGRGGLRAWEAYVYRRWAAGHLGQDRPRAALAPAWERARREPASIEGWWVLLKSAALAGRDGHRSSRSACVTG